MFGWCLGEGIWVRGDGSTGLKELSFTWWSFFSTALASAVASASKAILSKKVLDGKPLGENLTPANMSAHPSHYPLATSPALTAHNGQLRQTALQVALLGLHRRCAFSAQEAC